MKLVETGRFVSTKIKHEIATFRADPNVRRALHDGKARQDTARTPAEIERAVASTVADVAGAVLFSVVTRTGRRAVLTVAKN